MRHQASELASTLLGEGAQRRREGADKRARTGTARVRLQSAAASHVVLHTSNVLESGEKKGTGIA